MVSDDDPGTPPRRDAGLPVSEWVHQQISEMIVSGTVAPGERLREVKLATSLGTSRVPVREALQRLADEGWVTRLPRVGARVNVPTIDDVNEVFGLRLVLEREAVRLAASHISLDEAERLKEFIVAGRVAADQGDAAALVEANRAFHAGVAALSGSSLLCQLLALLDRRVRWLFGSVAVPRSGHSLAEHEELIEALLARDEARADTVIAGHVAATREALRAQWGPRASTSTILEG